MRSVPQMTAVLVLALALGAGGCASKPAKPPAAPAGGESAGTNAEGAACANAAIGGGYKESWSDGDSKGTEYRDNSTFAEGLRGRLSAAAAALSACTSGTPMGLGNIPD